MPRLAQGTQGRCSALCCSQTVPSPFPGAAAGSGALSLRAGWSCQFPTCVQPPLLLVGARSPSARSRALGFPQVFPFVTPQVADSIVPTEGRSSTPTCSKVIPCSGLVSVRARIRTQVCLGTMDRRTWRASHGVTGSDMTE